MMCQCLLLVVIGTAWEDHKDPGKVERNSSTMWVAKDVESMEAYGSRIFIPPGQAAMLHMDWLQKPARKSRPITGNACAAKVMILPPITVDRNVVSNFSRTLSRPPQPLNPIN